MDCMSQLSWPNCIANPIFMTTYCNGWCENAGMTQQNIRNWRPSVPTQLPSASSFQHNQRRLGRPQRRLGRPQRRQPIGRQDRVETALQCFHANKTSQKIKCVDDQVERASHQTARTASKPHSGDTPRSCGSP